ncbi:MAG TPA: DNA alkylation repair protein [Ignavibacteria bacterium]|nr:DNA alkylation repair protein [Ignavibacteria bacterium]HMR38928.1 DNA alkylation repair protein [Ignavibacteria bacterium]
MNDSLLKDSEKSAILSAINIKDYSGIISLLEKIKTSHADTAKTKDKKFVIKEIVKFIEQNPGKSGREFFESGNKLCNMKEDNAKEIGVSVIWRGFKYSPEKVKKQLLKIADDPNWEVREYAGTVFAEALKHNDCFYADILKWTKHPSENVRRAVVFSAIGLRNEKDIKKAFAIFKPMMHDDSRYVKKNLGPFILGSYFGNAFPEDVLNQLKKWSKIKDEHVRWNIIMSFNNSFGNKYPDEALEVIRMFLDDENKTVRRAVKSSLNHLSKRHPGKVKEFRNKHDLNVI